MRITVINGTEKHGVTYMLKEILLDHFGYRWMSHRPAKEMFGKRAVIITQ